MGGTYKQLQEQLAEKKARLKTIIDEGGGSESFDVSKVKSLSGTRDEKRQQIKELTDSATAIKQCLEAVDQGHYDRPGGEASDRFSTGREWATVVKARLDRTAQARGVKALTSGSIDTPSPLLPDVVGKANNPARVVDLLTQRQKISGNEFEFLRQSVRTNNAAPVADDALKPTSVYTVTPVEDRARVIAHLSEAIPERILADHTEVLRWLEMEMYGGVVDAVENQLVNGTGVGENLTGILNTSGIGTQAFSINIYETLRKARTALQIAYENPNAVVLHPTNAETMDLMKTADGAWLIGSGLGNILGNVTPIVSTSVPVNTALMGDWSHVRLLVREELRLDADRSGALFDRNQVKFRAEGRYGMAVLRPSAFTKVTVA